MLVRFFLLCCLMLFCSLSYSKDCNYEEQKIHIPDHINTTCQELSEMLDEVRIQVQAAQKFFQFIAIKDKERSEQFEDKRDRIIPKTLKLFSENARVQITNKERQTPKESLIKVYLNDLANLSNNYEKITLDSDKNFKFLFKTRADGTVAVDMVTFQGFEGCINKEQSCYEDVTRKVFHVSGTLPIAKGRIKISGITADETMSHKDFENKKISLSN